MKQNKKSRNCVAVGASSAPPAQQGFITDTATRFICPVCKYPYTNVKDMAECQAKDEDDLQKQMTQVEYDEVNGLVQQDQ